MFNIVLYNSKNKSEQHIIITKENGKITASGYAREKGQKKPLPSNVIEQFIDLIKLKEFSKYIGEVEGYKLYEDEYEYIHFFKDDKEDYTKFLLFNGKEAILNTAKKAEPNSKKNSSKLERVIDFLIKGLPKLIVLEIVVAGVLICYSTRIPIEALRAEWGAEYVECNTIDDVIARINAQDNLTVEEKNLLINKETLAIAIEYSEGEILEKLGWGIYIIESSEEDSEAMNNADGYYHNLTPHVLNIDTDLAENKRAATILHEYGHLLQNPLCPLFLREMAADEIAEISGTCNRAYRNGYVNYGLLKAIVGDNALKECEYSQDDDYDAKLKAELCKYISEEQYKELMKKLDCKSSSVAGSAEYNEELYAILLEIATLKYGEENVERLKELVANSLRADSITKAGVRLNEAILYGICTEERYRSNCTIYVKETTPSEYATYSLGNRISKDGVRIDDVIVNERKYYLCYYAQEGELPPNGYELYWGDPYIEAEFLSRTFLLPPKKIEEERVEISYPCAIYSLEDLFGFVLRGQGPSKTLTGP